MGKAKLTGNMSTMDMVMTMCEGNPGAVQVIVQMINKPEGILNILLCDSLDIRGSKLYMLHNDCCDRNEDKFNRTLDMIGDGVFSEEEIHDNLNLIRAIPFIDDSIVIDGVPPYGKDFGPGDAKWDEFCQKNRESYLKRLGEKLGQQRSPKKI